MRLTYFVHDLNDPAVAKRLAMLRAGGMDVTLTGFWRGVAPQRVSGSEVLPLAQTFDSRLMHRALTTLCHASAAGQLAKRFNDADIFLARNLEMLVVASAVARYSRNPPAIAYEVLDIHRTLLSSGFGAKVLRSVERLLMRNVALLVTSSRAFLNQYFEPRQFRRRSVPALVVENKAFSSALQRGSRTPVSSGPPWRIGWFGVIRCRRSLEMLGALARRRPDLVQIQIRGRIAEPVREALDHLARDTPALRCGGLYRAEELPELYGGVHFNWAIDYFEEGGNSEWLLPNRLYEGGSFEVVPVALGRTETGRWLRKKQLGVLLDEPETELENFFEKLSADDYLALRCACSQIPRTEFVTTQDDCDGLVAALERAAGVWAQSALGALYATT